MTVGEGKEDDKRAEDSRQEVREGEGRCQGSEAIKCCPKKIG